MKKKDNNDDVVNVNEMLKETQVVNGDISQKTFITADSMHFHISFVFIYSPFFFLEP